MAGVQLMASERRKIVIGSRYVIFRRGNYVMRRFWPFVQRGPFLTFTASWQWGQLEFGMKRWL